MPTTDPSSHCRPVSPALVVLAGWVAPGLGYILIGQRARGITIGLTVILLFIAGLLIGGIRVLEVPGWGSHGQRVMAFDVYDANQFLGNVYGESEPREARGRTTVDGWAMRTHPMEEIRAKPWSIAQIMAGPIAIVAGAGAVEASRHSDSQAASGDEIANNPALPTNLYPVGARSHARVNEIGVLYTAIAGMLNLLAIIDSASRAAQDQQFPGQETK